MRLINFKHLHYFWIVAKTGSIARAAKQLHLTPQTISGQISLFESVLGYELFHRIGRRLELNDAGQIAMSYADEIFSLGEELEKTLKSQSGIGMLQFNVGVTDAVPKTIAYRLLKPALEMPQPVRIVCHEGKITNLLSQLGVHHLDVVIADCPIPHTVNVRGFSHLLGACGLTFFASKRLLPKRAKPFPGCLSGLPFLLPGETAMVRPTLMQWLEKKEIRYSIAGEFEDGALLKAFGKAGAGVFTAPSVIENDVIRHYDVISLGTVDEIVERFYAISVERKIIHPAVIAISSSARQELFIKPQ